MKSRMTLVAILMTSLFRFSLVHTFNSSLSFSFPSFFLRAFYTLSTELGAEDTVVTQVDIVPAFVEFRV